MNDKLLITIIRAILDIGDAKRKLREYLPTLEAKVSEPAPAPPQVALPASVGKKGGN